LRRWTACDFDFEERCESLAADGVARIVARLSES